MGAARRAGKHGAGMWRDVALVVAGTLLTFALTRPVWDSANFDVGEYYKDALAFWAGSPPGGFGRPPLVRALPLEYPPGAVAPFALSLLPLGDPVTAFMVGAAAAFLLGYLLFRRFSGLRTANRYALYALLGAQGTLLDRYDLFPALLTVGALWCAQRNRFIWAYVWLAGGVALKLYPAVLLPALVIAHWQATASTAAGAPGLGRRAARVGAGLAVFGALVALTTLAPMLLARDGLSPLRYALDRPVQVESAQGTLVWLGALLGVPAQVVQSFASQGFVGPLAGALSGPALVALVFGGAWVCWRQARGRFTVGAAFLALLCLLLLAGKVFSAQYILWVLPIAAEVGGSELAWAAVALLTSLEYPLLFPYSKGIPPLAEVWPFLLAVAARNLALAALTLRLLVRRSDRTVNMRADGVDADASETGYPFGVGRSLSQGISRGL